MTACRSPCAPPKNTRPSGDISPPISCVECEQLLESTGGDWRSHPATVIVASHPIMDAASTSSCAGASDSHVYASEMEMGVSPKAVHTGQSSECQCYFGPPITSSWEEDFAKLRRTESEVAVQRYEQKLSEDAQKHYFANEFDSAAFLFARALRAAQLSGRDAELEATLTSNLGSALHNMGEFDEAIEKYQEALRIFERCHGARGPVGKWMGGQATLRRTAFVRDRLQMATQGERPEPGKYLDSNAREATRGAEATQPAVTAQDLYSSASTPW